MAGFMFENSSISIHVLLLFLRFVPYNFLKVVFFSNIESDKDQIKAFVNCSPNQVWTVIL